MSRSFSLVATLALLFFLMIGLGYVLAAPAAAAPLAPDIHVQASGADGLILEIVVPPLHRESQGLGAEVSERIALDGYAVGQQGLPVRHLLLGLPPSGGVSITIEPLSPARVVQGPVPSIRAPRVVEEHEGVAVQADWEWRPLEDRPRALPLASLAAEGYLREWRVAQLRLAPMAYLGNNRWELTSHFRVHVAFENPAEASLPSSSAPFSALVTELLLNGEQAIDWRSTAPAIQPTSVYTLPETTWRIGVTADGVYRLTYDALDAAGVPVAGAAPADIHLWWRDQEVALQEVGTGNGTLDPGDSFLFYGQKFHGSVQDEKYTDENVYWLEIDASQPGLRMASRSVAPGGLATPATWYTATVRSEENNVYWARWSNHPGTEATWFWERILTTNPVTPTYPLTVTDLATDPYTASLQVEVAARSVMPHRLRLSVNDTPIGEETWFGDLGRVMTMPFTSTLLLEGENDIGVAILTDSGTQDIYVNWVEATFRRQTVAQDDTLALSASFDGDASYTLTEFGTDSPHLYDLSDPLVPTVLSDANALSNGSTWDIEFDDSGTAGQPYLAVADSQIQDVSDLTLYEPPLDLLSATKGADELIIVPDEFHADILPLADHRRAEGLRVEVVRVEDVYALFNGGVFHPKAIRDFVAYAYEHWQGPAPAYVLLVGDGHFNFKGYNPTDYGELTPIYIPPYLDFLDPWQGEVPVDTKFGQIVGDDVFVDVAVGRLATNSVQEVQNVVTKIIDYETEATPDSWNQLLHVADNVPDPAGDFEAVLNGLGDDFVPDWMQVKQVYLNNYSTTLSATLALTETWSQGIAMLTFMGHGSIHRWTHEPLLINTQIDTLKPGHQLPLVITLNCLDGYWMMPPKYPSINNTRSIAEWTTITPTIGSIASFSPTGLGINSDEEKIARNMYDTIFTDGERRLGEIALAGQLTADTIYTHLPQVSTLFGDPAGRLRLAKEAVYLPLVLRSAASE